MLKGAIFIAMLAAALLAVFPTSSQAEEFCNFDGCADFPAGAISFADEVTAYMPAGILHPLVMETDEALSVPDTDQANLLECAQLIECNFLTLGHGGSAVFKFNDNVLTGSGDAAEDLFIFETGPFTQGMNVDISKDGMTWYSVGSVIGDVDGIDIDAHFATHGFTIKDVFRYVRLTDDNIISPEEQDETALIAGADIDAVGTLSGASRAQQLQQHLLSWVDNGVDIIDYLARGRTVGNPQVFVDYLDVDVNSGTTGPSLRFFASDTEIIDIASLPRFPLEPRALVAVLGLNQITGGVQVKIKDWGDGMLRSGLTFDPNFDPQWLRVVPDTSGAGGWPEMAVLGIHDSGNVRVQMKDGGTNVLLNIVYYDPNYAPFGFTVIGDIIGGGAPELVVFGTDAAGRVRAEIRDSMMDTRTGGHPMTPGFVYFDRNFSPLIGIGVDTDGDGANDALAVLGSDDAGNLRAQVKSAADGSLVGRVPFDRSSGSLRMVALSTLDGLGGAALGVLQAGPTGSLRVQAKTIATGAVVKNVPLHPGSTPLDLIVIPDVDGSGYSEYAYLGTEPVDGVFVQVKDVFTGMRVDRKNLAD